MEDAQKPEEKKEPEKTPIEKVNAVLKAFEFIKFDGKVFQVDHEELKAYLTPRLLNVGQLSERGRLLAALNGGMSNIDPDTFALNSQLASVQVGFDNFPKFDLNTIKDANLLMGLYMSVQAYNAFFRKTPLGLII